MYLGRFLEFEPLGQFIIKKKWRKLYEDRS